MNCRWAFSSFFFACLINRSRSVCVALIQPIDEPGVEQSFVFLRSLKTKRNGSDKEICRRTFANDVDVVDRHINVHAVTPTSFVFTIYTMDRGGREASVHCTFLKNILSFHTDMGFLNTVTEPSRSVPPNRYTEHSLTGWYSPPPPPPQFARPMAGARPALAARATALVDDADRTSAALELNAVDELSANVLGGAGRFISRISNALSLSSSRLSGGLFNLT